MRTFLLFALLAAPLAAQRVEGRFTAGVSSYADDGIVNHAALGGSARIYFSRRWSVEPEYLHLRHNANFFRDRHHLLWGNVAVDILARDRAIVPYWFAAPGYIRNSFSFGSITSSNGEAAFGTGAGARFYFDRLFVAPQFRMGVADGPFFEITGSIGWVIKK